MSNTEKKFPFTLVHASIGVRIPKQAAEALAELTDGEARPFPVVHAEAYVCAWGGAARGQLIEFYPFEAKLLPTDTGATIEKRPDAGEYTSTHFAITTDKSSAEIAAIADRYGFRNGAYNRGPFHVHEVWLQNEVMIELLPPAFQAEYAAMFA